MFCKACKYKLGKSDISSLAGIVNWGISDLGVVPHRNESTRCFGFVVLFCCFNLLICLLLPA